MNTKQAEQAPDPSAALRLREVEHRYGALHVLGPLDLAVAPDETVALVGPSGCGKSSLLELLAGLAEPSAGSISVDGGAQPSARLAGCALMPQRDLLFPWLRALDNAALPLRLAGHRAAAAREQAAPLFTRLGLGGFERARPAELSGGMRQRVAFARTLLAGKPVLLLDEPFAALDAITRAGLQEWLLQALAAAPRTVVLVTHDVEEALFVADRTVVLSERPGRPLLELAVPRRPQGARADVVTSERFLAARDAALHALAGGAR